MAVGNANVDELTGLSPSGQHVVSRAQLENTGCNFDQFLDGEFLQQVGVGQKQSSVPGLVSERLYFVASRLFLEVTAVPLVFAATEAHARALFADLFGSGKRFSLNARRTTAR